MILNNLFFAIPQLGRLSGICEIPNWDRYCFIAERPRLLSLTIAK